MRTLKGMPLPHMRTARHFSRPRAKISDPRHKFTNKSLRELFIRPIAPLPPKSAPTLPPDATDAFQSSQSLLMHMNKGRCFRNDFQIQQRGC